MDPDPSHGARAAVGADRVELYTEPYARAFATPQQQVCVALPGGRARRVAVGLGVNAGHDLNSGQPGRVSVAVPGVLEVSIGHALIADALEFGAAHGRLNCADQTRRGARAELQ